jgi:hypothetical protein
MHLGVVEEGGAHTEANEAYEEIDDGNMNEAEASASDASSRALPDAGGDVDSTTSISSTSN